MMPIGTATLRAAEKGSSQGKGRPAADRHTDGVVRWYGPGFCLLSSSLSSPSLTIKPIKTWA